MEVGQAGQVGRLARAPVVLVLPHGQEVARIQSRSLAAKLVLASPRKPSLVKTLIVVSIMYNSVTSTAFFQPVDCENSHKI